MGSTTSNISIYIPAAGETNYDSSFAAGMQNIDQHDHSGGPTGGVPISTTGLADGSVTYPKLAANVADTTTGIGVSGAAGANQLSILGLLRSIYNIPTAGGFISKNGTGANARTITGTNNQVTVTNGDGTAGDPVISLPAAIYRNISFNNGTNILSSYRTAEFTPTFTFGGVSAGTGTRDAKYWRIGSLVFVNIVVTVSTVVGTGLAAIGNIPFGSSNDTKYFQVLNMSGKVNLYPVGTTFLCAEMLPNSTEIILNACGQGNRAQLTAAAFAVGDEFEISGFYWTDAS